MKKLIFLLILSSLVAFSCKKNNSSLNENCPYEPSTIVAPLLEQHALHDSLIVHGIEATMDSSGFFYTINKPGSGPTVTDLCTTVAVFYKGTFLNGEVFDSTTTGTPAIFQVGRVITGWQKAIPLIAKGGEITLYIPPSLAYGSKNVVNPNTGDTVIPANSNLVFHVQLADLQQ